MASLELQTLANVAPEGAITLQGEGSPGVRHATKFLPFKATGVMFLKSGNVKIRDGRGTTRTIPVGKTDGWVLGVWHAVQVVQVFSTDTTVAADSLWFGW